MKTFEQFEDDPFGEDRVFTPIHLEKYLKLLQSIDKIKNEKLFHFRVGDPPMISFNVKRPSGKSIDFIIIESESNNVHLFIYGRGRRGEDFTHSELLTKCNKEELEEKMQKLFRIIYLNDTIQFEL